MIITWTEVAARVRLYMLTSDLTSLVPPQFSHLAASEESWHRLSSSSSSSSFLGVGLWVRVAIMSIFSFVPSQVVQYNPAVHILDV